MDKIDTCQKGWKTAENASLANRETGLPTMKSLNAKKDEGAAEENAAPKKDAPAAEDKADKVDNVDKAPEEMSAAASLQVALETDVHSGGDWYMAK